MSAIAASTDSVAVEGAPRTRDGGLLLLRLVIGLVMAVHGTQQLFGWFGGGGIEGTAKFFTSIGYSASTLMAVLAALSQLAGGLGLAAGLLTPLAAAAVIGAMTNAAVAISAGAFFLPRGKGEYEVVLAVAAAVIALTGPGRFSIDRRLPLLRTDRVNLGLAAIALGVLSAVLVLLLFHS
jgi:putative oxidoreductase